MRGGGVTKKVETAGVMFQLAYNSQTLPLQCPPPPVWITFTLRLTLWTDSVLVKQKPTSCPFSLSLTPFPYPYTKLKANINHGFWEIEAHTTFFMQLPPRNASRELASLLQINGEITSALHYVQVSNLVFLIVNTTGTGEEDEQVGYVQLLAFMLAAFVFFFFHSWSSETICWILSMLCLHLIVTLFWEGKWREMLQACMIIHSNFSYC